MANERRPALCYLQRNTAVKYLLSRLSRHIHQARIPSWLLLMRQRWGLLEIRPDDWCLMSRVSALTKHLISSTLYIIRQQQAA